MLFFYIIIFIPDVGFVNVHTGLCLPQIVFTLCRSVHVSLESAQLKRSITWAESVIVNEIADRTSFVSMFHPRNPVCNFLCISPCFFEYNLYFFCKKKH